jgi:hypothetical protein
VVVVAWVAVTTLVTVMLASVLVAGAIRTAAERTEVMGKVPIKTNVNKLINLLQRAIFGGVFLVYYYVRRARLLGDAMNDGRRFIIHWRIFELYHRLFIDTKNDYLVK